MAVNNIPITSSELCALNHVDANSKALDFAYADFSYYTSFSTAQKILSGHCFYVSNITKMNDKHEVSLHGEGSNFVHALCFCNTRSEALPMWYLYGGLTGSGVRLVFTPGNLLLFMREIVEVYPVENGSPDCTSPLKIGKDFELECGWVNYRRQDSDKVIFFKQKWYELSDPENFKCYFVKDYPWEYEREFRFLFHNKTGKALDRIALKIPDKVYSKLKIAFAPESKIESLTENPPFNAFKTNKISKSALDVKMDLLDRNRADVIAYLANYVSNNRSEIPSDEKAAIGHLYEVLKSMHN